MNKLDVQAFIEQHPNWEIILSQKPYNLIITRDVFHDKKLIMFKYSQFDSNFNEKIVRECRGIIFNEENFQPICVPFFKFGNYNESYAASIDWSTAKTATKIDGSLIKIVKINGDLLISTNGSIDAFKAPVSEIRCKYKSFGEITQAALDMKNVSISDFEEGYTYMFELTSPWTRIVVPWKETELWYLGRRDNKTFQEEHFSKDPFNGKFKLPEVFPLQTIDECIAATKDMPWDEEGYVVCDANFNRVKIKSPAYIAVHGMCSNHVMSYSRAIDIVRANEIDEICSYFEEFRAILEECKSRFWKLVSDVEQEWMKYLEIDASLPTRKDKAIWITKNFSIPGLAFGLLDRKIKSVKDFFMEIPAEKILMYLGYDD